MNSVKTLQTEKGFTLVEIAIVLVIIGLLLGGVLKGQELIENAKLKAVKSDTDSIYTAILSYQDRFGTLPGDGADGTADNAVTTDGSITATESTQANDGTWVELRAEGFLSGSGAANPTNGFGGEISIEAGTGGIVLCNTGLNADQMDIVDTRFDDGERTTGSINYAAEDADALDTGTASIGAAVPGGELCIAF